MKYIHVKSLEKYHPKYKDRTLQWAKIYFNMVQGDPDCEMIVDEIDWARLLKFILLELQAKRPIPMDSSYLTKKGFNLKKRPIDLTLRMLHNFLICVSDDYTDKDKEEDKEDKDKEDKDDYLSFEKEFFSAWNNLSEKHPEISKILSISDSRRKHLKARYDNPDFKKHWVQCISKIADSSFLLGDNQKGWKVSFDWIIENNTNFLKVVEGKYSGSKKQDNLPDYVRNSKSRL